MHAASAGVYALAPPATQCTFLAGVTVGLTGSRSGNACIPALHTMHLPATLLTAALVLPLLPAQNLLITFEEAGIVAMGNSPGAAVPAASRVSDRFLPSHGVSFRSTGGFVAVVIHGANTPSPPNIIGGTTAAGALSYQQPITIRFFDPNDTTQPGVTDFLRVRGDLTPLGTGTVTMQAFAVDDTLLGTITVPDVAPGPVLTLTASLPGIHRAVLTGTSGTVGFDNVEFQPVRRAARYAGYGAGCPGALGVPVLAAVAGSLPLPGTTFTAQVTGVPNAVAVMVTGFSDTQNGPFPLPLPLDPFGLFGCTLHAEALITQLLFAAGNTASWPLALPPGTGLLGVRFFQQAMTLDPTANPAGFALSNAAAATVGS